MDLSGNLFRSTLQEHCNRGAGAIYNDLWLWVDKTVNLKILLMHPGKNPFGFIIYVGYIIKLRRKNKKSLFNIKCVRLMQMYWTRH